MTFYPVKPVPAPRQVRKDRWNPSPSVLRYRSFKDEVKMRGIDVKNGAVVIFHFCIPKSYTKARKKALLGTLHQVKPDKDNLEKALLDALYKNDSHIADVHCLKVWGEPGGIEIVYGEDARRRVDEIRQKSCHISTELCDYYG